MDDMMINDSELFDMEYEEDTDCYSSYEWEESDFQLEMDYNPYMGQYDFEYDMAY